MPNPTSEAMSARPSRMSQPMSRLGSLAGANEPTKASEALVEVLSATLHQANSGIAATTAGGRGVTLPGKIEPAHSLAHTSGAPVAVLLNPGNNGGNNGTTEPADAPRAPIGLGHAMPNTDMSRGASRQSVGAASLANGVDPSALIVHHLRQLITEEIGRADGMTEDAEPQPRQSEGTERLLSMSGPQRSGTGMTNYISARASVDSRSTMMAPSPIEKDVAMAKESAPSLAAPAGRMGPMTPSQAHLPLMQSQPHTFPNPWAKARYYMREPLAEALGTFILMIFGNGINAQVALSRLVDPTSPKGDFLSVSFGWGIGVAMGVYAAGGISGGHINPAVTISFAIFRGFPWRKVPLYILGQMVGAFVGALVIYGIYSNPLHSVDPDQTELTAAIFATYPVDYLRTSTTRISCFLNESVGSAILLLVIMALGDSNNTPPVDGMAPLALLWLVVGIGACLGWQTSYAINPARDIGPRLMLWAVGYTPEVVWTFDALYFLWAPCLATIVGGIVGCFLYDALCYTGAESPLNAELKMPSFFRRASSGAHGRSGGASAGSPNSLSSSFHQEHTHIEPETKA
ncbi:hypothetical protein OC835_003392 [Tilletia horrida]|nr:hypothetical protein OC835_003392 [Tilletia horrida]